MIGKQKFTNHANLADNESLVNKVLPKAREFLVCSVSLYGVYYLLCFYHFQNLESLDYLVTCFCNGEAQDLYLIGGSQRLVGVF